MASSAKAAPESIIVAVPRALRPDDARSLCAAPTAAVELKSAKPMLVRITRSSVSSTSPPSSATTAVRAAIVSPPTSDQPAVRLIVPRGSSLTPAGIGS